MKKGILSRLIAVLFAAAACLSAVKVFAAADAGQAGSIAYINDFSGDCEVLRSGAAAREPLTEIYSPLYEGDTLYTGSGSAIEIVFDDATIVNIDENSQLKIEDLKRDQDFITRLSLAAGKAIAVVNRLMAKEEFSISTKMAVAAVKGTEFEVRAGEEHSVGVFDGAVEVSGLDDKGGVVKKVVLEKGKTTTIDRASRMPREIRALDKSFARSQEKARAMRSKIEKFREMKKSGRLDAYKKALKAKMKEKREKKKEKLKRLLRKD